MKGKSSSIIVLSKSGSQKLDKILREPPTAKQKESYERSIGLYSFYQKRWQEKNQ